MGKPERKKVVGGGVFCGKLGHHSKLLVGHSSPLWDRNPASLVATKLRLPCAPPPHQHPRLRMLSAERGMQGRVMGGGDLGVREEETSGV